MARPREQLVLSRNVLSQDEVRDLIQRTRPVDPLSIRNRAIVELFYACGLRTSELCDLKVGDVDLKEQTVVIVHGKGGRSRVVPIGQYAAHYIELYLARARKYMLAGRREDPGNLFLSSRGNPFDRSSINKTVMRSVAKALTGDKRISAYWFRHYAEFRTIPSSGATTRRQSRKRGPEGTRASQALGIVLRSTCC